MPNAVDEGDETLGVPFEGPHARLSLAFDPASFVPDPYAEVWPKATVTYEGEGLKGTVRVEFFRHSVPAFVREFATAHRDLRGVATLDSEDGDFRLVASFGGRGEVTLTGHLQPDVLSATKLLYEIDTDQSYLNATVVALAALPRPSP